MQDEYTRSRGFALTLARRAVDDLRRDRFRQLRNYVDLCQALAKKSRYNEFFSRAQEVLQRADSLYDSLIQTLLDQVDGERLCGFGVNFGAGGIVYGAARLKEEIERTGCPGAWLNTANCASAGLEEAVSRAEEAGKYVWILYAEDAVAAARGAALAKAHPFSAFALVAVPRVFNAMPADAFDDCCNLNLGVLLPGMHLDEEVCLAAQRMKERRLLFGFSVLVDDASVARAVDPQWLEELSRWAPMCMYARKPDMSEAAARDLRKAVIALRTESAAPLLLLEWDGDLQAVNRGISDHAVVGAPVDAQASFPFSRG